MSPQPVPKEMNPSETQGKVVGATGFEPVAQDAQTKAAVDSPPLPQGNLAPPEAGELRFSPQSSPIPKAGPTVKRHQSKQNYGTPWEFIRACERRFGLRCAWDLAANAGNAKADRFYDLEMNSLAQPWQSISAPGGFLWLNPPFDNIAPWAEKCAEHATDPLCAPILFFTPASIGANWFKQHVHGKALVIALNGRIVFDGQTEPPDWQHRNPGKVWKPQGYPKDCMLSVFKPGIQPGFDVWTWEESL